MGEREGLGERGTGGGTAPLAAWTLQGKRTVVLGSWLRVRALSRAPLFLPIPMHVCECV